MSDELDDYEEGAERAEAREDEIEQELALADAAELGDSAAELDETRFDETRLAYSGVEEGDGDVDVQELEEAGARLDDPEGETPRTDLQTPLRTVEIMNTGRLHEPGTRRARTSGRAPSNAVRPVVPGGRPVGGGVASVLLIVRSRSCDHFDLWRFRLPVARQTLGREFLSLHSHDMF
jgi:hypothetical protein